MKLLSGDSSSFSSTLYDTIESRKDVLEWFVSALTEWHLTTALKL
jgi:hypothetical protein